MAEGPPSFEKLWEQIEDESPLPNETHKEFRRRIEKAVNLLKRLAADYATQSAKMDFFAAENLERDFLASARVGLERIRNNCEADISVRRKKEKKKRFTE